MTDKTNRELLELAAKAAGLDVNEQRPGRLFLPHPTDKAFLGKEWNPLTDDGDAIRLAVNLELDLNLGQGGTLVYMKRGTPTVEEYSEDCMSAFRRAIVRAAAAIGEAMP